MKLKNNPSVLMNKILTFHIIRQKNKELLRPRRKELLKDLPALKRI